MIVAVMTIAPAMSPVDVLTTREDLLMGLLVARIKMNRAAEKQAARHRPPASTAPSAGGYSTQHIGSMDGLRAFLAATGKRSNTQHSGLSTQD